MEHPELPLNGTCRCGQLRFEITLPPLLTAACHCRGCQRMSASAFSLTAMMPADGFNVVAGDPVQGGIHGPQLEHFFCPNCKSWVFTKMVEARQFINVRPTMFEDTAWARPFIETMTRDKLAWATTPAKYTFEAFPSMEEVPRLIKEFAAQGA